MNKHTVEIFGFIKHETEAAILLNDGDTEVWLPKSQIEYDMPNKYNQTTVEIPEWLAIEKELA